MRNGFGEGAGIESGYWSSSIRSHSLSNERDSEMKELYFQAIRWGRMTASSCACCFLKDLPKGVNLKKSLRIYAREKVWEVMAQKHPDKKVPGIFVNDFMRRGKRWSRWLFRRFGTGPASTSK